MSEPKLSDGIALIDVLRDLPDPRVKGRTFHRLIDIVVIAIIAHLCGCDEWVEIALFGRVRETFFRKFLELPNGIPSHDTFRRVFMILDPKALEAGYANWIRSAIEVTEGQVIAIDGKEVRRSATKGKGALRMVSAWATASGVVLGQRRVDSKTNEISALPELFDNIRVRGCVVTADAMHCQTNTTKQVIEHGADYLLSLKGNQAKLEHATRNVFDQAEAEQFANVQGHTRFESVSHDHGRHEVRQCTVITDPEYISYVDPNAKFVGLKSIVRVRVTRRKGTAKAKTEIRHYISSLAKDASVLNAHVRSHWQIENSLHWMLDVPLDEDRRRNRSGNSAENMTVLRHITISLMKQDFEAKVGVKARRKQASWDEDYLLRLLRVQI